MKYLGKFKCKSSAKSFFGEYDSGLGKVTPIESLFYPRKTASEIDFSTLEILCPVEPTKILCIGKNYKAHAEEFDSKVPEKPLIFLKALNALANPNEEIPMPDFSNRIDYEGEIAVVVGKKASKVSEEDAMNFVLGFTCANDVTARDIQKGDGQWSRGKSIDRFCPVGPWVLKNTPTVDFNNFSIKTFLNGKEVQSSNTSKMIFKIPFLISYISQAFTLYPGDIILTGTPEGVGPMSKGDEITVDVKQIGKLTNRTI